MYQENDRAEIQLASLILGPIYHYTMLSLIQKFWIKKLNKHYLKFLYLDLTAVSTLVYPRLSFHSPHTVDTQFREQLKFLCFQVCLSSKCVTCLQFQICDALPQISCPPPSQERLSQESSKSCMETGMVAAVVLTFWAWSLYGVI